MRPGDAVVGMLPGVAQSKVRPAVVIASEAYLKQRPDAIVGILTSKLPQFPAATDYVLRDWVLARLRAESCFRAFVLTIHRPELTVIGHLSNRDWAAVQVRVLRAFSLG